MLLTLLLLLLAAAPAYADDLFYPCTAVSQSPGLPPVEVACHENFGKGSVRIVPGAGLDIDLVNYVYGNADDSSNPSATVTATLSQDLSVSLTFVVTGGTGDGELTPYSSFSDFEGFSGIGLQSYFQSNFLPLGGHASSIPIPPPIPFTFNQPFTLFLDSDIFGSTTGYGPATNVAVWEVIQQWDVRYAITDETGSVIPGATISAVPEIGASWLLASILVVLLGSARMRHRAQMD